MPVAHAPIGQAIYVYLNSITRWATGSYAPHALYVVNGFVHQVLPAVSPPLLI